MKLARTKPIRVVDDERRFLVGQSPKVALGYCFGTLHWPFVKSKDALREYDIARMAKGLAPTVWYQLPQAGLYIDHNRNSVVEKFMTTDAEWLLQIDTDIEFPPNIVELLLARAGSDKKILAASVPLPGFQLPDGTKVDATSAWQVTDQLGVWRGVPASMLTADGLEVDGLATAVMIVHRSVFEAIAEREGQCWFFKLLLPRVHEERSNFAWMENGPVSDRRYVSVGEDLAFCMRAKDAGFKMWCCQIEGLRHHKTMPLSHDFEMPEPAQEAATR